MTQIVVPIHGANRDQIDNLALCCCAEHADLIELRLDLCIKSGASTADIFSCLGQWPLPVIVTCRHASEGGAWDASLGSEVDRLQLLKEADQAGAAYVDIELSHYQVGSLSLQHAQLILSYHDFHGMGTDLTAKVSAMYDAGATIAKIAVQPEDAYQLDTLAEICARFGSFGNERPGGNKGLIVIGMGEVGLPTRLLAGAWGCAMTFARLSSDTGGTAPGQPTIKELDKRYRLRMQSSETCIFGIIGNPICHSLSPVLPEFLCVTD